MTEGKHHVSCETAHGPKCNCSCGGRYHRVAYEQRAAGELKNILAVGDVVICHDWQPTNNKLGFVEEIIIDPNQDSWNKLQASGKYSIYGLNQAKFSATGESFYYGDFMGKSLVNTGRKLTVADLEKYLQDKPITDKGIRQDVAKVIRNLGRTSERN